MAEYDCCLYCTNDVCGDDRCPVEKNKFDEYVKRGDLLKHKEHLYNYGMVVGLLDVMKEPAADVAEVRHGEWVKNKSKFYVCSECDTTCPYNVNDGGIWYWTCRYCPICGARMDGKGADNG